MKRGVGPDVLHDEDEQRGPPADEAHRLGRYATGVVGVSQPKLADLIITDADPSVDLGTLDRPRAVIQHGIVRREGQ